MELSGQGGRADFWAVCPSVELAGTSGRRLSRASYWRVTELSYAPVYRPGSELIIPESERKQRIVPESERKQRGPANFSYLGVTGIAVRFHSRPFEMGASCARMHIAPEDLGSVDSGPVGGLDAEADAWPPKVSRRRCVDTLTRLGASAREASSVPSSLAPSVVDGGSQAAPSPPPLSPLLSAQPFCAPSAPPSPLLSTQLPPPIALEISRRRNMGPERREIPMGPI